jgi:hypothetical protein
MLGVMQKVTDTAANRAQGDMTLLKQEQKGDQATVASTLEELGVCIKAMVSKSDNYLISAGLRLIEAHDRIEAGEEKMTWTEFLSKHCNLSPSRAYELMRIARGKITVAASRERARMGMARSRARARTRMRYERTSVRNVTHRFETDGLRSEMNRLQVALDAYDDLTPDEREQFLQARHLREVKPEKLNGDGR